MNSEMDNRMRNIPTLMVPDDGSEKCATPPVGGPFSPDMSRNATLMSPSSIFSRLSCERTCQDRHNPTCETGCRRRSSIEFPTQWRKRLRHFTWAWFTMTMSTGGLSACWHQLPYTFPAHHTLGMVIYIANLVFFATYTILIIARFVLYKHSARNSWLHPTEALFIPCWLVTVGVMLVAGTMYASDGQGPWFHKTMAVLFWIYCGLAIVISGLSFLVMWATQTHTIASMTPQWIFPIYPCLLVGPLAGELAAYEPVPASLNILIAGTTIQGIGFLIALMVYAAFISRLMTDKLPHISVRPGMFISVGPSAFTIIGLVRMGDALQASHAFGPTIAGVDGKLAEDIIRIVSVWAGVWLWGLAFWFCLVTIGAHLMHLIQKQQTIAFRMNWWSFIFPNSALTLATFALADAFDSAVMRVVGVVMMGILIFLWIFIFCKMLLAVHRHEILWDGKDEDRDEGGFKGLRADKSVILICPLNSR